MQYNSDQQMLNCMEEMTYSRVNCIICNLNFNTKQQLDKHMEIAHLINIPNIVKAHACSFCSFQSAYKANMEEHVRTHTGEKPLSCSYCQFTTAQRATLSRHLKRCAEKNKYELYNSEQE